MSAPDDRMGTVFTVILGIMFVVAVAVGIGLVWLVWLVSLAVRAVL